MSGSGGRKPKVVKIDRAALSDARRKRHKQDHGGIGGFLVTLAIVAAAGGVFLYVQRDKPQAPAPVPVQQTESPEPVLEEVLQDDPVEDIAEPAEPIAIVEEDPQPRHDHLSPELLEPSTRRIILQAGRLNGYPEHVGSPASRDFGLITAPGTVVRVEPDRIREDFPQTILPGQSVVLHFREIEPQNLLFRAKTVRRDDPSAMFNPTQDQPALRILCNDNTIWDRNLSRQGFVIDALIPASYLESYRNTLTLQNVGNLPVVFDTLWIESAHAAREPVHFAIRDWHRIPDQYKGQFAWNRERESGQRIHRIPVNHDPFLRDPINRFETALRREEKIADPFEGLWFYRNSATGIHEQEQVAQLFLERAVGWFFHGGSMLAIENMTGPGQFFCQHTGRLYPSAYVLWLFSRLFEGETTRLPVNVLPPYGQEQPLRQIYWMATENQPGEASILIARSRFGRAPGGKVRIVGALPWRGTTTITTYNNVFPDFVNIGKPTNRAVFRDGIREDDPDGAYDRNREENTFNRRIARNGEGGLLDIELDMQDSLYIRLVREGTKPMEPPAISEDEPPPTSGPPVTVVAGGDVTETRESGLLRQKRLLVFPHVMRPLTSNYRVRIDNATRGTVDGIEYVVPETPKSLFCEIDYTQGQPRTAEGALLALHTFRERLAGKTISFWVYPHAQTPDRSVMLRMALGSWQGRVRLQPRQWQRVKLQIADAEPGRQLLLMGPPDYDSRDREDTITFEFNGIKLLDPRGTAGHYMDARLLPDGRLAIVILGEPGKEGSARQVFTKPVGVKNVTVVGDAETDIKWTYTAESQILEVSGLRFPETADTAVLTHLNRQEREMCRQSELVPIVLITEIDI